MARKLIGPTGSRRRRRLVLLLPLAAIAALVLAIASSASNSTLVSFEIDGNLVATTTNGDTEDWLNSTGTGANSASAALFCDGTPCTPADVKDGSGLGFAELFRDDLKVDPDHTTFTQGDKENDYTNVQTYDSGTGQLQSDTPWHIVTGSVPPNKDDLFDVVTNTYIFGSDAELDLGMVRTNNNGSSHVDFELNQQDWTAGGGDGVACAKDTTGIDGFVCPKRTEGDLLISFEISPSSTTPPVAVNTRYFVWDLPGGTDAGGHGRGDVNCEGPLSGNEKTCPWEEIQPPANTSILLTASNADPLAAAPWGSRLPDGTPTATYPAGGWFEAAIDLDELGFAPSCPGFGTASAKARSSGSSVTSALTDLAGPFPVDLNTCGKITIVKDAVPNDAQDFGFSTTSPGSSIDSSFSLDDDSNATLSNTKEFDDIAPGTYTFTEGDPTALSPKWDLTGLVCENAAGDTVSTHGVDLTTRTATVNLGNLGDVTCTFTNTKRATLIVEKQTVPDGATGNFTFTSSDIPGFPTSIKSPDDNILSDGQSFTVENLNPASDYTVTESDPTPNFDLTGISCDDGSSTEASTGSVATRTATFKLEPGETVKCTFTNTQRNSLIIKKVAKDASTTTPGNELLGGATFKIEPNPTTGDSFMTVTDDMTGDQFNTTAGLICIDNVKPTISSFKITETDAPTGYKMAAAQDAVTSSVGTCTSRGTSVADATFVNDPLSSIEIIFKSLAAGAQGDATKATEISCKDSSDATRSSTGTTNVDETFSDLEADTYTCTIVIDP